MKNSYLVPQQVPSFVLTEYPAFVEFLQAYYQWLEQEYSIGSIESLVDLESTIDNFVKYFQKELDSYGILDTINNRFFLKNIKQLYKAKGTELAFQYFFRLVYGKEAEINYPWDRVLKCSDGKWTQDTALFVRIVTGDPELIVGKIVDVQFLNNVYKVAIERYEPVEIYVDGQLQQHESVYQFYVDREYYNQIPVGARVTYEKIFVGYTANTTTEIKIFKAGLGFRVGELHDIRDGTGSGSILKITKINSDGGITGVQIVKFGTDYHTESVLSLLPTGGGIYDEPVDPGGLPDGYIKVFPQDYYKGLTERGQINYYNYNIDNSDGHGSAILPSYAGILVQGFYDETPTGSFIDPKYLAKLQIKTGSVAKYPGYYASNDGLLSEDIYLQDNYYYQVYSYEIKIEEQLQNYKQILKQVLHPSGYALFGKYDIRNEFEVSSYIDNIVTRIEPYHVDHVIVNAVINNIDQSKGFIDINSDLSDLTRLTSLKKFTDTSTESDAGVIWKNGEFYFDITYTTVAETGSYFTGYVEYI